MYLIMNFVVYIGLTLRKWHIEQRSTILQSNRHQPINTIRPGFKTSVCERHISGPTSD